MSAGRGVYAAMLLATFLWGSLSPASKAIVGQVGPIQQTLVRSTSAFVLLTLFVLIALGPAALRQAMSRPADVIVQGLLSFCISSLTNIMALEYISASLQTVLVATYPVILVVVGLFERGVTVRALAGTLVALVGIVVVVGGDDPVAMISGGVDMRGVGLSLLTALVISGSQRFGQRNARRGEPAATMAVAAGAAIVPNVIITLVFGDFGEIVRAPLEVALLLAYVGIFCTAINFGLWFWALKYVSAARAAPLQYLTTPIGVLLAWYFLDEPLTVWLLAGGILVIGGVALSQFGRRVEPSVTTVPPEPVLAER